MRVEATYRVTTPLFLGGYDQQSTAELRPPSLKGLLRFWFRAVALARMGDWRSVAQAEKVLFGSTERQAAFLLSIEQQEGLAADSAGNQWKEQDGLNYLGYGVVDRKGKSRTYFREGGCFTLRLTARPQALQNEQDIQEKQAMLIQAVKALGLFGGAGARARRGFGSLCLESLRKDGQEQWFIPRDVEQFSSQLRGFLQELGLARGGGLPAYTAFGSQTKVCIICSGRDPRQVLNEVGKELLRHRSYGHSDQKSGRHLLPWREPAEQRFHDDHDLVYKFLTGRQVDRHPRRVVFGLPHNYFFLSTKQRVSVETESQDLKRRASPLFIHIHSLASGDYVAVISVIPAVFLPENERIQLKGGHRSVSVRCQVDYDTVDEFLNRSFSNKVVVWP